MDHSKLYQHRFDELLKIVKHGRKFHDFQEREDDQIIDICGNGFREYQRLIYHNESWVIDTIKKIIRGLFDLEGIKYDIPRYEEKKPRGGMRKVRPFAFTVKEKKGIIAYVFLYRQSEGLIEIRNKYKKYKGIDGVRFYFLQRDYRKQIDMLNDIERKDDESFLEFYSIQDFFEQKFGEEEFSAFMEHVNKFNERARNLIGYKTVEMPTEVAIRAFKKKKADMLKDRNYTLTISNKIESTQKSIIIDNFINNNRYLILTGNSDFADSFVSSEWYYGIHTVTGSIDQTGLVTGYLKSIEQLLYALIRLAINKNRRIGINLKKKDRFPGKIYYENDIDFTEVNEVYADTTLGSLIHFVKRRNKAGGFYNADLFEVDSATIQIIIDKLYPFKDVERNTSLHKRNLYSRQEIDDIREKAIELYCLLLGSFKISSGDYAKLIAYDTHEVLPETINEEELIEIIIEWATPIMMFDMPKKSHTVAFNIIKFEGRDWELNLLGLNNIPEDKYKTYEWSCGMIYASSITNNNLKWKSEGELKEEYYKIIRVFRIIMSGDSKLANMLREYQEVVIGDLMRVTEVLFRK